MTDPARHWDAVYRSTAADAVSWFQGSADVSVRLIREVAPDVSSPILDVGSGASVLVDQLLAAGYHDLTAIDLSGAALAVSRGRLGSRAAGVTWLVGDILSHELPARSVAVWHDRAMFHFLTDATDRARYLRQLRRAVRPGGHVILATFAPEGPPRCSGLAVMRHDPGSVQRELGPGFTLVSSERESHRTPTGTTQPFSYAVCRRDPTQTRTPPR